MLIEMIIATFALFCLLTGIRGAYVSDWRFTTLVPALWVVVVMTVELLTAINATSTNVSDIGSIRQISWPVILGALITFWRFNAWWLSAEEV